MERKLKMENILEKTYEFAKKYHESDRSGHDFAHIKRVYENMNKLLQGEQMADRFVCQMSALLHDVDDHKLYTDGKNTERFLQSLNMDSHLIEKILETIDAISFSKSGAHPQFKTIEMKLLSDADKLDAMGAIGICRALNFGFSKQQPLLIENEFPKSENSKKTVINHFFEKLLLLKDAMQTVSGKREAEKRHLFMVSFLKQFFAEQNLVEWQKILDSFLSANKMQE